MPFQSIGFRCALSFHISESAAASQTDSYREGAQKQEVFCTLRRGMEAMQQLLPTRLFCRHSSRGQFPVTHSFLFCPEYQYERQLGGGDLGDFEPGVGQPSDVCSMHKGQFSPEHQHKAEVTTSIRWEGCAGLLLHLWKRSCFLPFFWKDHRVHGEGLQENLTSILLGIGGVGEGEPNNKTQQHFSAVKATRIQ